MDSNVDGTTKSVTLGSEKELHAASKIHHEIIRSKIELLRSRGVNLLLSSQPVSGLIMFLCLEADIAVIGGLEEDEVLRISTAAHTPVLTSSGVKKCA